MLKVYIIITTNLNLRSWAAQASSACQDCCVPLSYLHIIIITIIIAEKITTMITLITREMEIERGANLGNIFSSDKNVDRGLAGTVLAVGGAGGGHHDDDDDDDDDDEDDDDDNLEFQFCPSQ